MEHSPVPADIDGMASEAIDAALKVHRALGPGLLEGAYEACLEHELRRRKVSVLRQVILPVRYEGIEVEAGFRLDLLVGSKLIIEVKAVDVLKKVHTAQLLTYLRLSGLRLGLLMNFNVELFKNGVRRVVI